MAVVSVKQALSGSIEAGNTVTVRGWVRTRRDSKAGLSFVNVSDGSCFDPIQAVVTDQASQLRKRGKAPHRGRGRDRHRHPGGLARQGPELRDPGRLK